MNLQQWIASENEIEQINKSARLGTPDEKALNLAFTERADRKPWDAVVSVLNKHYHEADMQAARALYSAVAAHDLQGQPVWPMAVAPPGSMKSELITALDGLQNIFLVDAITPKTFLSGQIADDRTPTDRPSSLLHRVGKSGILLIPDFSTIQEMKAEDRGGVFAALRKIFDGKFSKEFGTAQKVEAWEGRITVVVGTTPEIDRQRAAIQSLGERFVMVRWARAGVDAAMKAIVQDRATARADLQRAVRNLLVDLPVEDVVVSRHWQERIVSLAEVAVRGRTTVHRHPNTKEILEIPQPESSTRLAQQLCQLAKGSARLDRRAEVHKLDFSVAHRVAFDCMHPKRTAILVCASAGIWQSRPDSATRYAIDDLEAVGLLDERGRLTPDTENLFKIIAGSKSAVTISPPRANEELNMEVGGRSRESDTQGRVQ